MAQNISGPGLGLPFPGPVYPANLLNAPTNPATNVFNLAAGQALPLPANEFMVISKRGYAVLQWLDPVTTTWRTFQALGAGVARKVKSDGFAYRVANLTGCPTAAVVTNGGTAGYAQATTTVTPSTGNSQWQPVIGGQLSLTPTIVTVGSGYGMPPLVLCPFPPPPGIPASFTATISGGQLSAITTVNQGAGYPAAPALTILPNPFDPNFLAGGIVNATATVALVAASGSATAGKLTGLLCLNPGVSLAAAPTLTVTGAGNSATATAVMLWTATGITITTAGANYAANNEITSVGGITAATPAWTNPEIEMTDWVPRKASMLASLAGGAITGVTTIYDGGLFTGTPNALVLTNSAPTTFASVAFTLGGASDTILLQPT